MGLTPPLLLADFSPPVYEIDTDLLQLCDEAHEVTPNRVSRPPTAPDEGTPLGVKRVRLSPNPQEQLQLPLNKEPFIVLEEEEGEEEGRREHVLEDNSYAEAEKRRRFSTAL